MVRLHMGYQGKSRTEKPDDLRQTRPLFNDLNLNFSIGELSALISQFWDDIPISAIDWGETGLTVHGPRGSVELDYICGKLKLVAALVQITTKIDAEINGLQFKNKD